ncbi:hypothetical protein [Chitinophaga sp. sic0106]|uniref:hypothetical protein n=1 Tax=Chitinophaga sp. sic0106 TaxID=2854785 RepID=UPI001C47ECA8|nr:hypothetical protein [Chitinophaga sp. sic0106]MBV7531471.1 hypothetical protein [Chitinophaga sp. sic0106]
MKRISVKSIVIFFATTLTIGACKKNNNNDAPVKGLDAVMLADLLNGHAPKFETFTVDGAAGGVITTTKGTKFHVSGNAFITAAGQPVTGPVSISIKEIRDVSAMILADKATVTSDGRLLESYGEFFVKAAQGAQVLGLRPNNDSGIRVQVPARAAANGANKEVPMWSGDTTITLTQYGYNHINQPVTVTSQVQAVKGVAWNQIPFSFAFFNSTNSSMDFKLDSLLRWVNCDALASSPNPKTTVMAYFTNHFNTETAVSFGGEQPTMLFFKPKNLNTLVKFYNVILSAPTGKDGFHSYQSSIPIGQEGTFLAISALNGQLYAEQKTVVIGTPSGSDNYTTVSFDLQPVDATSLLALINGMNSK